MCKDKKSNNKGHLMAAVGRSLEHFVDAQRRDYSQACKELRYAGANRSCAQQLVVNAESQRGVNAVCVNFVACPGEG